MAAADNGGTVLATSPAPRSRGLQLQLLRGHTRCSLGPALRSGPHNADPLVEASALTTVVGPPPPRAVLGAVRPCQAAHAPALAPSQRPCPSVAAARPEQWRARQKGRHVLFPDRRGTQRPRRGRDEPEEGATFRTGTHRRPFAAGRLSAQPAARTSRPGPAARPRWPLPVRRRSPVRQRSGWTSLRLRRQGRCHCKR
jgi:hypothetical protein